MPFDTTDREDTPVIRQSTIPGGRYRRARLKGEDLYGKIGRTFDELARDAPIDDTRPWLEFYRREDEVDVLVPIDPEAAARASGARRR